VRASRSRTTREKDARTTYHGQLTGFDIRSFCEEKIVFSKYKSTVLFSVFVALSLPLVGCGEGKVSQCNKLTGSNNKFVDITKKSQAETSELEKVFDSGDFAQIKTAFGKVSTTLNSLDGEVKTLIQEANGLKLSDDKLKNFHDRYVKILTDAEKIFADGNKLFDKASKLETQEEIGALLPEFEAFDRSDKAIVEQQGKLIQEVNTYCGAT
jgi:regulator of replication initiation timing